MNAHGARERLKRREGKTRSVTPTPLSNHAARTQKRSALSFHPPSTPSSFSFLRPFSHPRPPSPCSLARLGALRVEVEQNYLLLYLFGPKAHCRTAVADSESVPLAAWVSLASASPSGSISDLADRLHIHDSAAVNAPSARLRGGSAARSSLAIRRVRMSVSTTGGRVARCELEHQKSAAVS